MPTRTRPSAMSSSSSHNNRYSASPAPSLLHFRHGHLADALIFYCDSRNLDFAPLLVKAHDPCVVAPTLSLTVASAAARSWCSPCSATANPTSVQERTAVQLLWCHRSPSPPQPARSQRSPRSATASPTQLAGARCRLTSPVPSLAVAYAAG